MRTREGSQSPRAFLASGNRKIRVWLRAFLCSPCDVFLEESQCPPPGVLGGAWVVGPAPVVEEGVPRPFIHFDIPRDALALQLRVEFASRPRCEVLLRVGADHGARAGDSGERARVHAVERGYRPESIVGAGPCY